MAVWYSEMNGKQMVSAHIGHRTSSRISRYLRSADLIIEVIDSRIPYTGKVCGKTDTFREKRRCIVFSKKDLMDTSEIQEWKRFYSERGIKTLFISLRDNASSKTITKFLSSFTSEKRTSLGVVVGLPNSGKSMFINLLKKRHSAPVGNKPGITKGVQWLRVSKSLFLLDTPGVIQPTKVDEPEIGFKLFTINAIEVREDVLQDYTLKLVGFIKERYPEMLYKRYNISEEILREWSNLKLLEEIGKQRGLLNKKGVVDFHNTAMFFRDEVGNGRLGKIVLENISDITRMKERRDESF